MACYGGGWDGPMTGNGCREGRILREGDAMGDFTISTAGRSASCSGAVASEATLTYQPVDNVGVPGRLVLSWTASAPVSLVVGDDCSSDGISEIACGSPATEGSLTLETTNVSQSLLIQSADAGVDFVVSATFEAEGCGNGVVDSQEECDDGNPQPGDGCSAQCLVEVDHVCSAATPVVLGSNSGSTFGGPAPSSYGCDGPESVYLFQPPADGILHLAVTSDTIMGIKVMADCQGFLTDTSLEGSLDNLNSPPSFSVSAFAGQPFWFSVKAVTPLDDGPFQLEASFEELEPGSP
jgi:cysteine-rich repeat protein